MILPSRRIVFTMTIFQKIIPTRRGLLLLGFADKSCVTNNHPNLSSLQEHLFLTH